jgi:uncharacterized membrane protein YdfJ with MMPL/SSD domain
VNRIPRLAAGVAAHPRRWLLLSLSGFLAFAAVGSTTGAPLRGGDEAFEDPTAESVQAETTLERALDRRASPELIVLVSAPRGPSDPRTRHTVIALTKRLRAVPRVANVEVLRPRSRPGRTLPHRLYVAATFRPGDEYRLEQLTDRLRASLSDQPGIVVGGTQATAAEIRSQIEEDLRRAELLALPLLLLLCAWAFRSLAAGLLPVLIGTVVIAAAAAALRMAAHLVDVSVFALNLVTATALALAVDYSLLLTARYREELATAPDRETALTRTLHSAGRTVLFSAVAIVLAMSVLLVFPQQFLRSMGIGGALVACLAVLAAFTVLPPILMTLRASRQEKDRGGRAGGWSRVADTITRRPLPFAVVSSLLLIAMAVPALETRFVDTDASVLPREADAHRVQNALRHDFSPGVLSPVVAVVQAGEQDRAAVVGFARRTRRLLPQATVRSPALIGRHAWLISITSPDEFRSSQSQSLVRELRAAPAPFPVSVTGETASFIDQQDSIGTHIPLAVGLLFASTFVVVFFFTRSLVLPLKAIVMSGLTTLAAFGVLVFVFQDGRFESLLAYSGQGALEATQPILMAVIVVALSTDYGIVLLSRVKEAHDGGVSDRDAVRSGLVHTGRIVTAAALILAVAIGAFATSKIIFVKEVGIGTAVAILLDASLVRVILVPALMVMLGRWNWWTPTFLHTRRTPTPEGRHE